MILNLAHRGASHYAPENTMPAFYKGLEMGAHGLETDLKISRDGVVFLHHDKDLSRTTNGSGAPSDHTWKQLRELDAGSWFAPEYAGERLVSLEQFLHRFGRRPIVMELELKEDGIEEAVLALLDAVREKITITSSSFERLRAVRRLDADLKLGFIVKKIDMVVIQQVKEIGCQKICPKIKELTAEDVKLAKENGLAVRACGIRSSQQLMRDALAFGVDGMTIDIPDRLAAWLAQEAAGSEDPESPDGGLAGNVGIR